MSDPYKVLGLTSQASDDEIKKAYRKLSRKYHPDTNMNNPNKDKAEEMFKLVQQAYEQIMDERTHGGRSGAYDSRRRRTGGNAGFDPGGDYGDDQEAARMRAAVNFIQNMRFREAVNVLNSLSMHARTAQWYYLSAFANARLGNNLTAMEHAQQAVNLAPDNQNYRILLNQLQYGRSWYTSRQTVYGMPSDMQVCSSSRMCSALCLAQVCCGSYGYAPIFCCI